jgi:predicted CopG family antitoxin
MKRVYVSDEVWEQLMKIKVEKRFRSVDEALRHLLGVQRQENPQEAVEVTPEEGSGDSDTPLQSQAAASAVEKRLPQPAVERASPSAGTNASTRAQKHRWGFCPQCLSTYNYPGKCPTCGVGLVPFDTEEGKQLYLKLKAERGAR